MCTLFVLKTPTDEERQREKDMLKTDPIMVRGRLRIIEVESGYDTDKDLEQNPIDTTEPLMRTKAVRGVAQKEKERRGRGNKAKSVYAEGSQVAFEFTQTLPLTDTQSTNRLGNIFASFAHESDAEETENEDEVEDPSEGEVTEAEGEETKNKTDSQE